MPVQLLDLRDLAEELETLRRRLASEGKLGTLDAERLDEIEKFESNLCHGTLAEYAENEPVGVPEHRFADYARDLTSEIGLIDEKTLDSWPFDHIDWEAAADALRQDYRRVELGDDGYLVRRY
jgi:hypothetical protein